MTALIVMPSDLMRTQATEIDNFESSARLKERADRLREMAKFDEILSTKFGLGAGLPFLGQAMGIAAAIAADKARQEREEAEALEVAAKAKEASEAVERERRAEAERLARVRERLEQDVDRSMREHRESLRPEGRGLDGTRPGGYRDPPMGRDFGNIG